MDEKELKMEELTPLNLRKYRTVDEIVQGMERCSFGARMLGEVSSTLYGMIDRGEEPLLVYDGKPDTPLGKLLQAMVVDQKWFKGIVLPEDYASGRVQAKNIVVVGPFSERHEDALHEKPERAIFINEEGRANPRQVKDGYFPDVVFSDPGYVLSLLYSSLDERLNGNSQTVTELFQSLKQHRGVSRHVSHGAETLWAMVQDPGCTVFMTISGAMTIAQMGLVFCDLIDDGSMNYIASTGALMAHGLAESIGLKHYKYNPAHTDAFLASMRLNRVTDTLEPETNFDHIEEVLDRVLDQLDGKEPLSPRIFHKMIGEYLARMYPQERGILKSAYEKNVPVMVPAFVDSEMGNDIYVHNLRRQREGKPRIIMDLELDTQNVIDAAIGAERIGIFTIGGGVPRNDVQNVAPLIEIADERLGLGLKHVRFSYGVRIAPDQMHYGHLSGCTYSEGMSWRKIDPHGKLSEIKADATLVLPFQAKYVRERREAA